MTDSTSMRHLPVLGPHQSALEKCVYCPKLCRASCPVSNAEPSESLIPWGKMSAAFLIARGDVAPSAPSAKVAWACTDCGACTQRCDHKNPVGDVLLDARSGLFEGGFAPARVRDLSTRWAATAADRRAALERIQPRDTARSARARLLVGCAYARRAPKEARLALAATRALLGEDVALATGCCGAPQLAAGDLAGFRREADALARELAPAHPVVVLDPGCQRTIAHHYTRAGLSIAPTTLLVDLAADSLHKLSTVPDAEAREAPRFHDPCQLGRGLGRYEAPRAIIEKVVGARPREFVRSRERADCSGGGSLLPLTYPEASARAAELRLAQHDEEGGGALVTACASSLHRFRKSRPGGRTYDITQLIARGLGIDSAYAADPDTAD